MPAALTDYEQIRAAQARARELNLQATQLQAGATTFEDEVRNRIQQARAARGTGQLAQDIGTVTGQLATEGPALRERTLEVAPLDVDRMVAAQRGQLLSSLATLAQTGREREGTIADIIGAGTARMQAQAQIAGGQAEFAAQEARDIMDLLGLQYKLAGGAAGAEGLGNIFDRYGIPVGQQGKITDNLKLLADLKETRGLLGTRERGYLESIGELTTGPLARLLSPMLPGEATRDRIDRLVSDIKQKKYGVAFTESEIRQAKRWAPSSMKQESTNIKRLDDLIREKEIAVQRTLRPYGATDFEINSLITTGRVEQTNPLLELFGGEAGGGWIDTGRVEER